MNRRFAILALGFGVTVWALPSFAQGILCGQRDAVVNELNGRYGEQIRDVGLANQNRIVEVYVSEETGSWTITVTNPNGLTCLMAAGLHFSQIEPAIRGEDL